MLAAAGFLVTAAACSRDDLYAGTTFEENVYAAYEECDPAEISFLASLHGIQLAFAACGSNRFAAFEWSPDGIEVYFQLTHGGHVMNAEAKTIAPVPLETPVGGATWVRKSVLLVPLAPADASAADLSGERVTKDALASALPYRLARYDNAARTVDIVDLPVREPRDLQPVGEGDRVALTGIGADGARRAWTFDPATGALAPLAPWLDRPVERLVFEPKAGLLAWSDGKNTELVRFADGSLVGRLPGVTRAIPHPGGRYVALETAGAPVSLFDQRTWNELSPDARERELARKEEWLKNLPDWAPREARPPEIQILDLEKGHRYRIVAFHGDQFEWYAARDYFCSFALWGIEGKQLHRNVALTDLAERLRMAEAGETVTDLAPVSDHDN